MRPGWRGWGWEGCVCPTEPGAPAAKAAPAHLPSSQFAMGGAQGLYPATQAGLVHVAVKVHVLTLFTLGLM